MQYQLYGCDVFVSVAGGLRLVEPALDLGILVAIASSFCNVMVDPETVVLGEVGLSGEVRSVPRIEARLKEAQRMGFCHAIVPARCKCSVTGMQITGVELVEEAIHALLASRV